MYWPIGAPKAYALNKHATAPSRTLHSEDGVGDDSVSEPSSSHAASTATESSAASEGRAMAAGPPLNGARDNGGHTVEAGDREILAANLSRGGTMFATITQSTLTVWQAKPTVALAAVVRSSQSMKAYGPNCALLLRPDALIIVVQTMLGYLITYSVATDPQAMVYRTQLPESHRHARRSSTDSYSTYQIANMAATDAGPAEGEGIREVNLRFRMVIRIDAGISKALALDEELVVATQKPAALQCIRWAVEEGAPQTSTELISRMPWYTSAGAIGEMVHDRPMNLMCWIAGDGRAYAVQRHSRNAEATGPGPRSLFQGFCFREPETESDTAVQVAINARFSLIAVGCAAGHVDVYMVKDYSGNVPFSDRHRSQAAVTTTGQLTRLVYSPDGYCLLVGYEKGWALWSVYGKALASSFSTDRALSEANDERWLHGVRDAFWIGGGCELVILDQHDDRLWVLDVARSAVTGCLAAANISRGLLHSSNSITVYKGHDLQDLTALPSDLSLWQTVQVPNSYLINQWPIKAAVVSPDSKYVAVAGRRGLAHYSVASGRWRTFEDPAAEQVFAVRGGMCWHQHFLILAVEAGNRYQLRIYSREKPLERAVYEEELAVPAILTTTSGSDSLLVYTYDNVLLHYIIAPSGSAVKLVQVGQIGFHGIIRAPPRVRAISWILPDDQMEHDDPAQDVATASVLFLVDGKLVLLQPSTNEHGELKYDMRVVAQNVEYYMLLRDQPSALIPLKASEEANRGADGLLGGALGHSLRDSLWYFDGDCYHVWSDVQDVLASAPVELGRDLPPTVRVPMDFYPISAMVDKGIVHGLDSDLVQRRDVNFSFFRHPARTQLFLPHLLRYHLAEYNSPAALHLANFYQHLHYFAHALEILLHDVLDSEVDNPPSPPETALLPTVVSFLSSFLAYLDVIVKCTRKTELRSWRTLFACLPPVQQLFEQSLEVGKLKTAAGYLLVLHAFEQDGFQVREFARLLKQAAEEQEWDLCGELARFLVGTDGTGDTLRDVLAEAGMRDGLDGEVASNGTSTADRATSLGSNGRPANEKGAQGQVGCPPIQGGESGEGADYFSMGPYG